MLQETGVVLFPVQLLLLYFPVRCPRGASSPLTIPFVLRREMLLQYFCGRAARLYLIVTERPPPRRSPVGVHRLAGTRRDTGRHSFTYQ